MIPFALNQTRSALLATDTELAAQRQAKAELEATITALEARRETQARLVQQLEQSVVAPANLMQAWQTQCQSVLSAWLGQPRSK